MAKVIDALKGLTAFPLPSRSVEWVAAKRGLNIEAEATQEVLTGKEFNLACADLYLWLYTAPNVSQGGQTYSFSLEQRTHFRNEAQRLFDLYAPKEVKPVYGYKGSKL